MKNSLKILVLGSLLISAGFASAQDPKQTAEKVYSKFMRYASAKNVKGIGTMLDSSYTMTDTDGKVSDRATTLAQMAEMCKNMRDATGSITVEQATQHGNEIIIWSTMKAKMSMKMNGKWTPMEFNEKFVETMVKTPEGWKFTSSIAIP